MKELTIEQKAKAYDEAKARMSRAWNENRCTLSFRNEIFPELAESEDERIRKEIIHHIKNCDDTIDEETEKRMIAWLEKQGESSDQIHYWTEEEIEPIISDYLRGAEHYGGMIGRLRCLKPKSLEKQGEKSLTVDIESMIEAYEQRLINQGNGVRNSPIVNMCVVAFKHGVENTLDELHLKQGETSPILSNSSNIGKDEQKPTIEMKSAEESLGIDSETYNEIVNDCIFGENKPKFKVGDWIINRTDATIMQIINNKDFYESVEIGGQRRTDTYNYIEWDFRLWTIQDAKDGDVLASEDNCICIFDNTVEEGKYPFAYCGLSMYGFKVYDRTLPFTHDNVYPATKEQRDLLFQKMKEAGYEWDAEDKQLKEIEQKTDWSNKEKLMLNDIIETTERSNIFKENYQRELIDWLKSLKNRVLPQPKQEWSKEDEKIALSIEQVMNCASLLNIVPEKVDKIRTWLKSLKQRIGG